MDWGGFLVVGVENRLPSKEGVGVRGEGGAVTEAESDVAVKSFEKWDINKVDGLVYSIGFVEAAETVLFSRPWYR